MIFKLKAARKPKAFIPPTAKAAVQSTSLQQGIRAGIIHWIRKRIAKFQFGLVLTQLFLVGSKTT
jgi:hypothetical protein